MVAHRIIDTRGWRTERAVAAGGLRVAVESASVAAIAGPASASGVPPAEQGIDVPGAADLAAAGDALVGSALGPLVGVLLVLLVLAGIGVAAWGPRPGDFGRLGRATSLQQWAPGGRLVGSDDASPDAVAAGDLLTDEERIIGLLEENGGRLKQQHVVETTDWSKAKVSRLLSSMEDDDAIVRIQIGREKLIFLSGHEPSGARPTHREDG